MCELFYDKVMFESTCKCTVLFIFVEILKSRKYRGFNKDGFLNLT